MAEITDVTAFLEIQQLKWMPAEKGAQNFFWDHSVVLVLYHCKDDQRVA